METTEKRELLIAFQRYKYMMAYGFKQSHEDAAKVVDDFLSILPDDGEKAEMTDEDIREKVKSLYVANYMDYQYLNADESFYMGIEVGVWGMKKQSNPNPQ